MKRSESSDVALGNRKSSDIPGLPGSGLDSPFYKQFITGVAANVVAGATSNDLIIASAIWPSFMETKRG